MARFEAPMQVLTCMAPYEFKYSEIRQPILRHGEALLRIKRIGICGTDLHAYDGTQPYFTYPRVLGHELSAEIVEIGPGLGFEKGEWVSVIPYYHCGKCVVCRQGKTNCCTSMKVLGVHMDGGMAEYMAVPVQYLLKDEGLDLDELALLEPLAIGAHGIRRARVKQGDRVLVIGAGPIGLGAMEFARIAGADVIAMDINPWKLDFCRKHIHPYQVLDARHDNVIQQLKKITCGDMPNVVIDCTGNLAAINRGFDYVAHGGIYVLIGLQKEQIMVDHPEFHKKEGLLMSSRNATLEDFSHVISCMKTGQVGALKYITHRIKLTELCAAFPSLLKSENNMIKAIVEC